MGFIIGLLIAFIIVLIFALCKINSRISREEEQRELDRWIEEFHTKHKKEEEE